MNCLKKSMVLNNFLKYSLYLQHWKLLKMKISLNASSGFYRYLLMELKKFQFQLSSFLIEVCSLIFSFHCTMPFFILLSSALHLWCWTQAVSSAVPGYWSRGELWIFSCPVSCYSVALTAQTWLFLQVKRCLSIKGSEHDFFLKNFLRKC